MSPTPSVAHSWGTTEDERSLAFPCDRHLPHVADAYHRAIDVATPASVVFRWLCQLRVAPYSYDWIDNFGRRSPRELTPGLERLELGQRFMTIFELAEFEPDRHLTLLTRRSSGALGGVAVTYLVQAHGPAHSRLLVKVLVHRAGRSPLARARRELMPWLDLVMMRKQLHTLRDLAEAHAPGQG